MARALRDSYSDIFLIKANPTASDKDAIQSKFKSFHNASDNVASLMAKTFLALLGLADLSASPSAVAPPKEVEPKKGKASVQEQRDPPAAESADNPFAGLALQHSNPSASDQGCRGVQRSIQILEGTSF